MSTLRSLTSVLGLVMVASTLSLTGSAATASVPAPSVSPSQPSIAVKAAVVGAPPRNYVMPPGSAFTFPNASPADRVAIRNRVLMTIQSVWGGKRDAYRLAVAGNGSIRIATWTFNDMAIAKALVAAHRRGVSVQIIGAAKANKRHRSWKYLRKALGGSIYQPGVVGSQERISFARTCAGACRGRGGTPHSKFFLFNNVGARHATNVVMSTSSNLTAFAVKGQWNEAQTYHSPQMHQQFRTIFGEARAGRPQRATYRVYRTANVTSLFFPRYGTTAGTDPVMQALNRTTCTGAGANGTGRTQVRIAQYAIYDTRGTWIAKKLRALWNAGCDVRIIYSVSTRPILGILRSGSGRGPVPMKQSVVTNSRRVVTKYNHSKWMTISGNWGGNRSSYLTFAGAANWSNAAFYNDEQMTQVVSYSTAAAHNRNFNRTWAQGSSHPPGYGSHSSEGRAMPPGNSNTIPWGKGAFKNMTPEG